MPVRSDAELGRAWRAGDHTAFAEAYDKYSQSLFGVAMGLVRDRAAAADVVHDTFVRAARRIDGLREPDRLRAWLFAILRHESADWHRRRGRERVENVAAMSDQLAADLPEPQANLSRAELADVIWSAAGALQQRDREVLELHVRAGLEAGDLAAALGVTPGHAAVLLSRMRDRMEKAIGALLIARLGRRDCTGLDGVLADWDGRFTLEVRSRVTRHVESCPVCTDGRMQLASYQQLAPAVLPVFLVPDLLRQRVLTSFDLVCQQSAPALGDGDANTWVWQDDGFPTSPPGRPTETVTDTGSATTPRSGTAGGAVVPGAGLGAAGQGTGLGAAGQGDLGARPPVDPWTPPAGSPPPGPSPATQAPAAVPAPRHGALRPLLMVGVVAVLIGGGVGIWRVASPSTDRAGSVPPTVGSGTPSAVGAAVTAQPTPSGTAVPRSGTATASPSPTPTSPNTTAATGTTTPTTPARTAPLLTAGVKGMAFGDGPSSTITRRTFRLLNDGGQPLTWTATRNATAFSVSPGSGTLAPKAAATVTVALDRGELAEGAVNGVLDITASPTGQAIHLPLTGSVSNPPVITIRSYSKLLAYADAPANGQRAECNPTTGTVLATVTDDSEVASVTLTWTDGGTRKVGLKQRGNTWVGGLGPFSSPKRTYTLTVVATDVHGNTSTAQFSVVVVTC